MKKLAALLVCGMLIGCEYAVPLVKAPAIAVDPAAVGVWERTKGDGQTERLLVLPLGEREYLVSFPAGAKDAMFARACLCRTAGITLVQLTWLGTARAKLPEDGRVFQFATYAITGDRLGVRLLNSEVVKKEAASAEELAKAIAADKDKPDLFREEMVFTRIKE